MRRFTLSLLLVLVASVVACSSGFAPTNTTAQAPDTTTHGVPVVPRLDSIRLGALDINGGLHIFPDSQDMSMGSRFVPGGSFAFVSFSSAVAFTNIGPVTDGSEVQAMFGAVTLSSDNLEIIAPGGNCTGGWTCMTVHDFGIVHLTLSVGGKSRLITFTVRQ